MWSFHPYICKDLLKGECVGKECNKGFHVFSIKKFNDAKKAKKKEKNVGQKEEEKKSENKL